MSHPSRLGKYAITGLLGEGAMGVVYKAFDPDIRRPVALKTIRRQLTDGSDFAATISARFRNEAQAAGRLSHPGIVGVYEYGEDGPVAYMAMEYVEGRSIASYLATKLRFTDDDVAGLITQLLDALDHAHAQGVWHRDIKPANVILSRGGALKIADFGIARIDGNGLTQANTMIGTPAYMAPEQFLGADIDARADIYSAGVLLYVLLSGQPPFSGTPEALMYKVVHEAPTPPSKVPDANRPMFYDAIVAKALAKKAGDRFPSARAFKDAIASAIGQPFDTASWDKTIVQAAPAAPTAGVATAAAGTDRPTVSGTGSGSSFGSTDAAVSRWDRAVLAEAEQTLAHFVGPLAPVLVRRAARDCDNAESLYARLAEQVTDPAARQAFLGRMRAGTTTGSSRSTGGGARSPSAGLGDALLERAKKRLAQDVGPIAGVVVRRAAEGAIGREAFFLRLCEAVNDPAARSRLLGDLNRLD